MLRIRIKWSNERLAVANRMNKRTTALASLGSPVTNLSGLKTDFTRKKLGEKSILKI